MLPEDVARWWTPLREERDARLVGFAVVRHRWPDAALVTGTRTLRQSLQALRPRPRFRAWAVLPGFSFALTPFRSGQIPVMQLLQPPAECIEARHRLARGQFVGHVLALPKPGTDGTFSNFENRG